MRWQINGVMMILVIKTSRIRAAKAALARPDGRVDGRAGRGNHRQTLVLSTVWVNVSSGQL